jgi:hypothetical protein
MQHIEATTHKDFLGHVFSAILVKALVPACAGLCRALSPGR